MQDLEYLIQILKFCEKELTKVVPGGVVGATLWKVAIDRYALKYTKHHYLQELVCSNVFFITTHPSFSMS